jgi:hypothetical protein
MDRRVAWDEPVEDRESDPQNSTLDEQDGEDRPLAISTRSRGKALAIESNKWDNRMRIYDIENNPLHISNLAAGP